MALTGTCENVRFMNNNLCCDATLTASSSASGFPVDNLKDENRTKFWKAAGLFEIDSTIQELYIDDGVPKTVTITNGSYEGGAALATQIETDLNAASSGWTVTYSTSTYKFTISHATATLVFTSTTDAIWDTIGYTGAADVVLSGALEADEIRIHTCEYIDVSSVAAFDVTFFGLITQIGTVMSLSASASVSLLANNVPVWDAPPFSLSISLNDQGYLTFMDDVDVYKNYRVKIEDRTNPAGPSAVCASYLYIGDYLTFTSSNIARGFSKSLVDTSEIQQARSGRTFFKQRTKYYEWTGLEIQLPTRAERKAFEQFVYDYGLTNPFFMSLDPGNCISDELVEMTRFVYFTDLPECSHQFLDRFNLTGFSVREVV